MTGETPARRFRALPVRSVQALFGRGPILVLAPHADDESLGCGGLIARCCAMGRPPFVLVATDGTGSHPNSRSHDAARRRRLREMEATAATRRLGLGRKRIGFLRLPDAGAPHAGPGFRRAVAAIARHVRAAGCTAIAAPWRGDPHCDHLAAHRMAAAAARALRIRHLGYPVWGWMLQAMPDGSEGGAAVAGARVESRRYRPAKRRAIAAHRSQVGLEIMDDPEGFTLPAALLAVANAPYEVFLTRQ